MLLDKGPVTGTASTFKIVMQVIEFDRDSNFIAGLGDTTHIIEVWFRFVVSQEAKSVYNLSADPHAEEVLESIRRILNHIMEKSGALFLRRFSCQTNRQWMEYDRVSVDIVLTAMSLQSYLKAKVNQPVC